MSSTSFDYYSALEVEKTATFQEVKDAYRRLALAYHPDKNPEDPAAATEIFQKIQVAYETLSDPALRAAYDAHSRAFQEPSSPDGSWEWESSSETEEELAEEIRRFFFGSRGERMAPENMGARTWRDVAREMEYDQERRRQQAVAEMNAERQARLDEEAARKKVKDDAKKKEDEIKNLAKDALRVMEQANQEAVWKAVNAVTKEEKLKACLHSEFCTKSHQQKKFKCGACGVKRGMTAFECPYCSLFLCQQCVVTYSKKRVAAEKKPEKKTQPQPQPQPQPEYASEPESEPEPQKQDPSTQPEAKSKPNRSKGGKNGKTQPAQNQNQNQNQSGPRCYNCDKVGHTSKNCTSAPKKHDSRSCYSCGQQGHVARRCPNRQSRAWAERERRHGQDF